MSCLSALYSQVVTLLSVPHEIILLQHRVFREYAKIAVGPDFIHTLPSFLILTAMVIVLWRNPPSLDTLAHVLSSTTLYKALQVSRSKVLGKTIKTTILACLRSKVTVSWVVAITVLWFWLILQRLLYCCVWMYWSYESEQRYISYQWWQRVWSSYYPPPLQPPLMSASFISWIISMSLAGITLSCALSTNRVWTRIVDSLGGLRNTSVIVKCYANSYLKRLLTSPSQQQWPLEESPKAKVVVPVDESEASSMCDDCRSEISSEMHNPARREVLPISYGTNWTPKPSFSGYKEPQRKVSVKSLHTVAVVNDLEDSDQLSPKHLRHRRNCHTVIPSNSSDKSSGC